MDFYKVVEQVLNEDNMAGGAASAFGPNVVNTATPISGDNYAKGDARNLFGGTFPGMLTRNGLIKGKRKKKKKYSYKKYSKKKK